MPQIQVPISFGELIDKITILEIKSKRISDLEKLANVRHERDLLNAVWQQAPESKTSITELRAALKAVNTELWVIEDDIRIKESTADFGQGFLDLARSVYFRNDERARLKKEINLRLGSELIEEKSYADYRRG